MNSRESIQPVPVVLVHWNQPASCVETIHRFQAATVPVAVTVVDNGSETSHLSTLRDSISELNESTLSHRLTSDEPLPPESSGETVCDIVGRSYVRLIETGRNLGFGPGANVGLTEFLADEAAGNWVVLAPHDADPATDCLEMMLGAAAAHPMAGLMCADVGDGMVPVIDPYFGGMTVPSASANATQSGWESVDYPHGTLMMLSRGCLREIGLFDERYFSYCEEAQLAVRARLSGFEIGLVRGARVTNTHIGSGVGTVDYLQTRNTLLFVREYSGRYHAFIRLCIGVIQLVHGFFDETYRPPIFDAEARALGMWDFLRGRFGPPPTSLFRSTSRRRRGAVRTNS